MDPLALLYRDVSNKIISLQFFKTLMLLTFMLLPELASKGSLLILQLPLPLPLPLPLAFAF